MDETLGRGTTAWSVVMSRSIVAMTCALLLTLAGLQPFCQPAQGDPILLDPQPRTVFGHTMSGRYDPLDIYATAHGWGIAFLDPDPPVHPLTRQNLYYNFFNVLNRQFPPATGWSFIGDARKFSDNSLRVHTYDAVGTANEVGADIDIEYRPTVGTRDPNPATDNLHWIQVVSNNHSITTGRHGDHDNKVDVPAANRNRSPYYDDGFAADSTNFLDKPRRFDVENDHDWIAALFLVSGPHPTAPGRVTIYNHAGILWGWKNRFFPNVDLVAFREEVHRAVLDNLSKELYKRYHDEFYAELAAIPEPAPFTLFITGVLCLCFYGWRQRRRLPCIG